MSKFRKAILEFHEMRIIIETTVKSDVSRHVCIPEPNDYYVSQALEDVADYYEIEIDELLESRVREHADIKHSAYYVLNKVLNIPFHVNDIAAGAGIHRTTIFHGINKVIGLINLGDEEIHRYVEEIKSILED